MAMGKVMPSYGISKPEPKHKAKAEQAAASEVVTQALGGFACPEMAMGKVIVRRQEPVIEEPKVVEQAATVEATPVETPAPKAVEPQVAPEAVADTAAIVEAEAAPAPVNTSSEIIVPTAFKGHASAPMAKAPGTTEMKEITVIAAPFREERYLSKGAGSQVASNKASAAMAKPQSF